jgi:hypothetical protein
LERELEELVRLLMDVDIRTGRMCVVGMNARTRVKVAKNFITDHVYRNRLNKRFLEDFTKLGSNVTEKIEPERIWLFTAFGTPEATRGACSALRLTALCPSFNPTSRKWDARFCPRENRLQARFSQRSRGRSFARTAGSFGFARASNASLLHCNINRPNTLGAVTLARLVREQLRKPRRDHCRGDVCVVRDVHAALAPFPRLSHQHPQAAGDLFARRPCLPKSAARARLTPLACFNGAAGALAGGDR